MKIKVCGLTLIEQLLQLFELNIDYAGLIFYEKSPRYVRVKLDPKTLTAIGNKGKLTGVFVNENVGAIKRRIEEFHLSAVQLCGSESPADCKELRKYVEVLKVIPVAEKQGDIQFLEKYFDHCDYFLFDTKSGKHGGTGKKFDWDILAEKTINKPFFLSGGISEEDAEIVNRFKHSDFAGVDINSRFEKSPGIKDIQKIKSFISQLKTL